MGFLFTLQAAVINKDMGLGLGPITRNVSAKKTSLMFTSIHVQCICTLVHNICIYI